MHESERSIVSCASLVDEIIKRLPRLMMKFLLFEFPTLAEGSGMVADCADEVELACEEMCGVFSRL